MATTYEDATSEQDELNREAAQLASLSLDIAEGRVEASAEMREEIARRSEAVETKAEAVKLAKQEKEWEQANDTAYDINPNKARSEKFVEDTRRTVSKAVYDAMCGNKSIRIAPPDVDYDSDTYEVSHTPRYERIQGRDTLVLQSRVSAPEEIYRKLMAPPSTRRSHFGQVTPGLPSEFTVQTNTDNAPTEIDYFNQILQQPQYGGNLYDSAVVRTVDRPDTKKYDIPAFGVGIEVDNLTEGTAMQENDPNFRETVLDAHEIGVDMSISKKAELASQDPMIVNALWEEMQRRSLDKICTQLTTGTGINQPHGIYTATQQAFQSGNNRVYGSNGNNSNYGNDNRNRHQVSKSGTDDTNNRLPFLTTVWSKINGHYCQGPKFGYQMHNEYAGKLLAHAAGDYNYAPTQLYPWAAVGGMKPPGVRFYHNGAPVYENPWLDTSDGTASNKLMVVGDFNEFWVRRSPMDLFISPHVKATSRQLYLQLVTYVDSAVPRWSEDAKRLGPFIFAEAVA